MPASQAPLWACPRRGHQFVTRNAWHSCGRFEVAADFVGKDALLRPTFDRVVEVAGGCGPVTVYAQKTRIVLMVRVRFGGVVVRKHRLDLGLWLTHAVEHPLLRRTEEFGPHSYGAHFTLAKPADIDGELEALICEAYRTGRQEHLPARSR